jgi:acyl-CoA thioesterase I
MKILQTKYLLALVALFTWAESSSAQLRILPFGDSVTSSYAGNASYRYWLNDAGFNVDFVGTQWGVEGGSPSRTDFDQHHEGHSGWHADDGMRNTESIVRATAPDVILLDLGSNDVLQEQDNQSTIEELRMIIQIARELRPNVVVLLGKPTPMSRSNKQLKKLNKLIGKLARRENTSSSPVYAVSLGKGFKAKRDTFDGEHPNETGEQKIAKAWFKQLDKIY